MYDNRILSWIGVRFAVYLSALVVTISVSGSAMADVATPPPSAPTAPTTIQTNIKEIPNGFPSTNALLRRGYDFETGTLKVPAKQQFGSVQNGMATKSNPVRITDPYGNVARTTVQTQTQLPSNSKLNQMATGYIYGQIAGNIVNSDNAKQSARDLAHGNYGSAAVNAAAAFDVFSVGSGIYGLFDEYANAKAEIAQSLKQAAKDKSEQAAAKYYAISEAGKQQAVSDARANGGYLYSYYLVINDERPGTHLGIFTDKPFDPAYFWYSSQTGKMTQQLLGDRSLQKHMPSIQPRPDISGHINVWLYSYKLSADDISQMTVPVAEPTLNDFLLNEQETRTAISNALENMLSNQKENTAAIKDLINMLWANNQLNAANTQTTVVGTPAQNTLVSEPYTPAGTNQAQQTQHVINADGSITTSYIPRPDLGANSSQAPARSPIGTSSIKPKKDKDLDLDIGGSDDKEMDICTDKNDDTVMCMHSGHDDYEDLEVPNKTEELVFNKKDYFAKNGVCPAPLRFNAFGMDMEISYEPWCDFARGIRPIIEFLGILTAMGIACGAVREL